ncbi:MAG: hypothetical protein WC880_01045 [Candidatus Paceibacterota bacterium]
MSGNIKVASGIILAAVVLGGGFYWYASTRPAPAPVAVAPTETQPTVPQGPTLATGADTSDASLSQDIASVDADMTAMNGDTTAIDAGLNDKAVAQ